MIIIEEQNNVKHHIDENLEIKNGNGLSDYGRIILYLLKERSMSTDVIGGKYSGNYFFLICFRQ